MPDQNATVTVVAKNAGIAARTATAAQQAAWRLGLSAVVAIKGATITLAVRGAAAKVASYVAAAKRF